MFDYSNDGRSSGHNGNIANEGCTKQTFSSSFGIFHLKPVFLRYCTFQKPTWNELLNSSFPINWEPPGTKMVVSIFLTLQYAKAQREVEFSKCRCRWMKLRATNTFRLHTHSITTAADNVHRIFSHFAWTYIRMYRKFNQNFKFCSPTSAKDGLNGETERFVQ